MSTELSVVPLESNPEIFTEFAHDLGLNKSYAFVDIYSLTDPDLLGFVPRPVKALILLFPVNEFFESAKNQSSETVHQGALNGGDRPIWFKQTVRNACGLYGLLHSLTNNRDLLDPSSKLQKFIDLNPKKNGQYDDSIADEFVVSLSQQHSDKFQQGQTQAPEATEDVDLHFITFVEHHGSIYELDGRRPGGAKLLGNVEGQESDLVSQHQVVERVQWYMNNADEQSKLNFSLLGLVQPWN